MSRAAGAALLGAALCVAGGAFAAPSLYVPGVALLGLAAVAAGWVGVAAAGARIERASGPATVEEDAPYRLAIDAATGALPAPGGGILEPLLGRELSMLGRGERRVRVDVRFARRGARALEPARLVIRDPLGLAERTLLSEPTEVLVLPRVERVESVPSRGRGGQALADAGPVPFAADSEVDGLRPHREGAPASRIHWPTVARTGELIERRTVAGEDTLPLVVLDPRGAESESALDSAVRAAASICVHVARLGGCALLLPGERRLADIGADLRGWAAAHARLAVVAAADGAPAVPPRGRRAAVIWVAASGRRPAQLERAGGARAWLVVPGASPGRRPEFTVAGCTGYRLGARALEAA